MHPLQHANTNKSFLHNHHVFPSIALPHHITLLLAFSDFILKASNFCHYCQCLLTEKTIMRAWWPPENQHSVPRPVCFHSKTNISCSPWPISHLECPVWSILRPALHLREFLLITHEFSRVGESFYMFQTVSDGKGFDNKILVKGDAEKYLYTSLRLRACLVYEAMLISHCIRTGKYRHNELQWIILTSAAFW